MGTSVGMGEQVGEGEFRHRGEALVKVEKSSVEVAATLVYASGAVVRIFFKRRKAE